MKVRGWRSISEYKEIMNIPNVKLFHPSASHENLFENCSLVVTIRGTSGLEAAFNQKPAIVFGDVPELVLPSIYKVQSLDSLPETIRNALSTDVKPTELDKYISWIEKNSFDFDVLGYENIESQYFYPGGILVDVDIPISKMEIFLKEHQPIFKKLIDEYLKKINESNIINSVSKSENKWAITHKKKTI